MLQFLTFFLFYLNSEATSVLYLQANDISVNGSAVIKETTSLSQRHCAQLCTADASCVSANYERDHNKCHLMASSTQQLISKAGVNSMISNRVEGE